MFKKIALNQGTLRHLPLPEALQVAKDAGYSAIGIWMGKIDECVASGKNLDDVCAMIVASGLKVVELDFLRDWLFVEGDARQNALQEAERMFMVAQKISAVCVCAPVFGAGDFELAVKNCRSVADLAAKYGVQLGLEIVPWDQINNLNDIWKLAQAVDRDNCGLIPDAFTLFAGPTNLEDFISIPKQKIFLIHMCDIKENHSDDIIYQARNLRVLPGEGDLDLKSLINYLSQIDYDGYYSLEILSKDAESKEAVPYAKLGRELLSDFLGERAAHNCVL
ncbi:MAG: sugar phosphate isomerase/epimerase [Gammaproteobacteria bacterium]|nr:sugar phosphate isomerase/epimerase [Gammaproteobacteria bacterium]